MRRTKNSKQTLSLQTHIQMIWLTCLMELLLMTEGTGSLIESENGSISLMQRNRQRCSGKSTGGGQQPLPTLPSYRGVSSYQVSMILAYGA